MRQLTLLDTRVAARTQRMCNGPRCQQRAAAAHASSTTLMGSGASQSKLQQFYLLAKATFASGRTPSLEELAPLQAALGAVPLEELGVTRLAQAAQAAGRAESNGAGVASPSAASAQPRSAPARKPITYQHIHEEKDFSIGIFCLPQSAQLPLHNHPGMTVLSRVLFGRMHVRAFDWVEADEAVASATSDGHAADSAVLPARRAARLVVDRELTGGDAPALLLPNSHGNIHAFTALHDCAVLDLLAPPYAPHDGRDCTYYREVQPESGGDGAVLEEFEPPGDFQVVQGVYGGLRVQPAWRGGLAGLFRRATP